MLVPHALAAPHLDGLTDPLVHLPRPRALRRHLIGQLGERAVGEGGEDLRRAREDKQDEWKPSFLEAETFLWTHEVHAQDVAERQLGAPRGHLVVAGAPRPRRLRLVSQRRADQVRVDVVFAQELIPLLPVSRLRLVDPAQTVQRGARDVDPPETRRHRSKVRGHRAPPSSATGEGLTRGRRRPPGCWRCPRPSSRRQTAISANPGRRRARSPSGRQSSCPLPAASPAARTCTHTPVTPVHIPLCVCVCECVPDGADHAEAHLHAAVGVVLTRLRKSRDAVITVAQDLYS